MSITGGQALVGQLRREGVEVVFGIPGVQLDWAVDALCEAADDIRFIVPRHEQATSYMADGYARTTGREGVCMMVPGPGMLNALAGLSTAWACNSRVLFISGQIPSPTIGKGYGMLHEIADQSGILKSLTKWHGIARTPEEIPALVHQAFVELRSGRPRPVALEFPPDVLQAKVDSVEFFDAAPFAPTPADAGLVAQAAALLAGAKFPVIHAGGGATAGDAGAALQALAEKLQAPVSLTEGGRGALPARHPLALTTLGGRCVLPQADVVLVAGSRFLDAMARPTHFSSSCQFIYLNVEPADMGAPRQPGLAIEGDIRLGLDAINEALGDIERPSRGADIAKVKSWEAGQTQAIKPQSDYADVLRTHIADDATLVSELTQVGYFSSIAYPVHKARTFVTPGYQGTLGYGFPTALGVAVGAPDKRTVSITGDGGFGWGLNDLATAAKYNLNLTTVVFADNRFGNVQRIQRRTFGREFAVELTNPDFQLLGKAFGLRTAQVCSPAELAGALEAAKKAGGPALIEVQVGEMPSPWALIHAFVPPVTPPPPNPLIDSKEG
ncbi:thiamine pyrophosphate-binding protein [Niveispirillum sp. KHB5.9]|uniref:thiamine pyrophosphate-binding protein n=1 Tax=Niveispirillum sp. KHB5.9 TaxID=3400269 RepID=UPI003A884406